jgi:hypothetical protein
MVVIGHKATCPRRPEAKISRSIKLVDYRAGVNRGGGVLSRH